MNNKGKIKHFSQRKKLFDDKPGLALGRDFYFRSMERYSSNEQWQLDRYFLLYYYFSTIIEHRWCSLRVDLQEQLDDRNLDIWFYYRQDKNNILLFQCFEYSLFQHNNIIAFKPIIIFRFRKFMFLLINK